ncbi:retinoic acid receptor responder protein 2 [Microcaecilia unicolor]|uniref:Retinoic acid receptor responder protein 2 n=1 Tax=Microcaecilia unicolor TaxID=1415580 RepID=A0A6P7XFF3_9AMPH|nr:retinoic acid receptor responder protein 2-like [Microcaecilia unicolor]
MLKALFLAVCLTWVTSYVPGTATQIELHGIHELKDKTVALAVANFNQRSSIHAYKELDTLNTTATATVTGTFVKVTFTIKETNCNKLGYQPDRCQHKGNGRVFYCVACFAYRAMEEESAAEFTDCVPRHPPTKGRANQQQQRCETVKRAIPDRYRPGEISIMAGLPSLDHNKGILREDVLNAS